MVEGERHPGRPARRRIDDILKWCGKDLRDAASMAEDRTKWRQFVTRLQSMLTMGPEEEEVFQRWWKFTTVIGLSVQKFFCKSSLASIPGERAGDRFPQSRGIHI